MQTNITIKCCRECPVEEIGGYCYTCKRFLCKECVLDHIWHEIVKIRDFCRERKVSVHGLATKVEKQSKKRIEIANMLKEIPMEYCLALYIAGKEDFLRKKACINCSIDKYCACDNADILFDIKEIMKMRLIHVGEGVGLTQPLKVEK